MLVYDLQEPFRWLAEITVLKAINSKNLDINDFYFTGDDYRYKIDPESKKKFMNLITGKINASVSYQNKRYKWDSMILAKTQELARYIKDDFSYLDFINPRARSNQRLLSIRKPYN